MMVESVAQARERSGARTFGQLLRDLRKGVGLRQDQLAERLGVHKSSVARIESGERNPPRQVWFYERLAGIEGIKPSDVAALMRTDGAPAWLFGEAVQPRAVAKPVPGVTIPLYLEDLDDAELEIIKGEVEMLIRDFYRRKMERAERLSSR